MRSLIEFFKGDWKNGLYVWGIFSKLMISWTNQHIQKFNEISIFLVLLNRNFFEDAL